MEVIAKLKQGYRFFWTTLYIHRHFVDMLYNKMYVRMLSPVKQISAAIW